MMKKQIKHSVVAFGFTVLIFTGACTHFPSDWPEFSGFLNNYQGLYRSIEMDRIFIYRHETKRVADYKQFLVDPVVVYLIPNAEAYHTDPEKMVGLARHFESRIVGALKEKYLLASGPGEGVLRVRVAIADLRNKKFNDKARIAIEAEFIDSGTGERIAALVTHAHGIKLSEWIEMLKVRLDEIASEAKIYRY